MEDEDSLLCMRLAKRVKSLQPLTKGYLRLQMEQLMFKAEFPGAAPPVNLPSLSEIGNLRGMSNLLGMSNNAAANYLTLPSQYGHSQTSCACTDSD